MLSKRERIVYFTLFFLGIFILPTRQLLNQIFAIIVNTDNGKILFLCRVTIYVYTIYLYESYYNFKIMQNEKIAKNISLISRRPTKYLIIVFVIVLSVFVIYMRYLSIHNSIKISIDTIIQVIGLIITSISILIAADQHIKEMIDKDTPVLIFKLENENTECDKRVIVDKSMSEENIVTDLVFVQIRNQTERAIYDMRIIYVLSNGCECRQENLFEQVNNSEVKIVELEFKYEYLNETTMEFKFELVYFNERCEEFSTEIYIEIDTQQEPRYKLKCEKQKRNYITVLGVG